MDRRRLVISILLIVCAVPFSGASADTFVVKPDGTGDFPTIQTAIDAATGGDVIELTDGSFTGEGNRDLDFLGKAITVRSQSGNPEACILHPEGGPADPHRGVIFQNEESGSSVLSGVMILQGGVIDPDQGGAILIGASCAPRIESCIFWGNLGSGIRCEEASAAVLTDCYFTYNQGEYGGAMSLHHAAVILENCEFVKNIGGHDAGAIWGYGAEVVANECWFYQNTAAFCAAVRLNDDSQGHFTGCLFQDNTAHSCGGALTFWISGPNFVERCTFAGNVSPSSGAAIWSEKISETYILDCTFYRNHASDATVLAGNHTVVLENCLLAFASQGAAVASPYGYAKLTCCDIYGNAGGDWVGSIADQYGIRGNLSEDPLLCAPWTGDYRLDAVSPCAEENNPECGQIGAWGIGCGQTPAAPSSWGAIKTLFR